MLLICLSPVMCCATLYSSALIFPVASGFMCICDLHVFLRVLLSRQPAALLVPRRKGSKPHSLHFLRCFLTQPAISCTRLTSCPQSKVILLSQSRRLVMTALSFSDDSPGLCFLLMSDLTHCCSASLPVDTFNFKKCQFSVISPW